jgi:hypothetical protein
MRSFARAAGLRKRRAAAKRSGDDAEHAAERADEAELPAAVATDSAASHSVPRHGVLTAALRAAGERHQANLRLWRDI